MPLLNLTVPTDLDNRRIKSYLYQLNEQLRYLLANLESENFSSALQAELERSKGAAEKALASADELESEVVQLGQEIVEKADAITRDYTVAVEQGVSNLRTEVTEQYEATASDIGTLNQRITSEVRQLSDQIQFTFGEDLKLVREELNEYQTQVQTQIRFSEEGMEIGRSDSRFKTVIDNDEMAFLQDAVKVAYLNNSTFYNTNAEIAGRLTIGNTANGYFDWIPQPNGNLSLKWREA